MFTREPLVLATYTGVYAKPLVYYGNTLVVFTA